MTASASMQLLLDHGLPRLTIRQINRLLSNGLVTSEDVCLYCYNLARAGENVWRLRSFANLSPRDEVLDHARQADERRNLGKQISLLDGIPISIKANIAVKTRPLTAGSRILGAATSDPPNVGYNADVTDALLDRGGAVLIGQTTMDEFGMGSLGTNVVLPHSESSCLTRNPLPFIHSLNGLPSRRTDQQVASILTLPEEAVYEVHERTLQCERDLDSRLYCAGGSSCGSAASVAHGSSLLSVASDTGGSIRLPAAWCGIVGLKPTYGRLSRHGLVSYASSLDTIGLLAPTADCVHTALQHVLKDASNTNHPPRDSNLCSSTQLFRTDINEGPDCDETVTGDALVGLRIGIPKALCVSECAGMVHDAWLQVAEDFQKLGASIETIGDDRISPEIIQKSLAAYYILVSAEASSNLARYDGFRFGVVASDNTEELDLNIEVDSDWSMLERQYANARTRGFGREVSRRVLCGTLVLSSDRFHTHYEAAAKLRASLTEQLHGVFDDYDILLFPTTVFPPPPLQEGVDPTEVFANDVMTVPASLAGLPSVSIPVNIPGKDDVSSFDPGLQVVGPRLGEESILRACRALEKVRSSH